MAAAVSGMTGALQGTATGVLNKGSSWLDSIFPPEKRNELMAKISKFATEKPMLASFLASQVALTGFPMGLFVVMTITVAIFAILAALIIGLLGAAIFIVVCVGFALIILLPTLFITTAAATFIWLWGVAGWYILKWFNKKEIPGIHTEPNGDTKLQLGAITGEGGPQGDPNGHPKEANGHPKEANGAPKEGRGGPKKGMDGVADKLGQAGKSTGVDMGNPKEAADVGKVAGKAQNTVGGAKGAVTGTIGL